LQDHGRALIVGDRHTHGKGTVQTLVHLDSFLRKDEVEEPGSLKFTVQAFYRIDGDTTQRKGVVPDYALPSTYDYLELGERHLPNALEVQPIQPAPRYQDLNLAAPYVDRLAAASKVRLKNDRDFNYIAEDIEILQEQLEDRRVSLNLAKRRAEKAEQEERKEERKEERSARENHDQDVFEFELTDVDDGNPLVSLAEVKLRKDAEKADAAEERAADDLAGEDAEEEEDLSTDPHLAETLHILSDYARLLKGATLAVNAANTPGKGVANEGTAAVQ
jgi:carboxyl-terminal processing protease